ncbi:MAG: ribose 5-phosphate isomerase B [Defluviitaleaceae bacterium]|nr:ribose 5-phosphate isomerase B [Defluviitaleaceae bacterium]
MKVIIGSDHAGYPMKKVLADFITSKGHQVTDVGAHSEESANYAAYGRLAADKLANGEADRAILICGTGFGISLAANSVQGVRCVNCTEPYTALLSRLHNNSNALALGARVIGPELAKMIIETWLDAEFEGGRHATRVDMLTQMSKNPQPGTYGDLS